MLPIKNQSGLLMKNMRAQELPNSEEEQSEESQERKVPTKSISTFFQLLNLLIDF